MTVSEAFEAGQAVAQARALNLALEIIAHVHSKMVRGETEVVRRMLEHAAGPALQRLA